MKVAAKFQIGTYLMISKFGLFDLSDYKGQNQYKFDNDKVEKQMKLYGLAYLFWISVSIRLAHLKESNAYLDLIYRETFHFRRYFDALITKQIYFGEKDKFTKHVLLLFLMNASIS